MLAFGTDPESIGAEAVVGSKWAQQRPMQRPEAAHRSSLGPSVGRSILALILRRHSTWLGPAQHQAPKEKGPTEAVGLARRAGTTGLQARGVVRGNGPQPKAWFGRGAGRRPLAHPRVQEGAVPSAWGLAGQAEPSQVRPKLVFFLIFSCIHMLANK